MILAPMKTLDVCILIMKVKKCTVKVLSLGWVAVVIQYRCCKIAIGYPAWCFYVFIYLNVFISFEERLIIALDFAHVVVRDCAGLRPCHPHSHWTHTHNTGHVGRSFQVRAVECRQMP